VGRINLGRGGRRVLLVIALVLVGHLALLYGVAEGRVGGTLFAAGDLWAVALVLLLVVVRFAAIVLLPGFVLFKVVGLVFRCPRFPPEDGNDEHPS
jgi:hypothetical protein